MGIFVFFGYPANAATTVELMTSVASSSWTTSYAPFNTGYYDSRAQSIYLKSDLEAVGMSGVTTITEVCLQASTQPGRNIANLRIRMQNSAVTSLSAFTTTGWTTVYGPTSYTRPIANAWACHTLTTPFVWDGVSNLMVDVYRNDTAYTSGGGNYTRIVASGRTYAGYCNNCTGCLVGGDCNTPTTRSAQARVLNIKLTFDGGGFVPPPGAPAAPTISGPLSGLTNTIYVFSLLSSETVTIVPQGKVVDVEKLAGAIDVAVQGIYAYVIGYDDNSLSVIDISNPANPVAVGSIVDSASTSLRFPSSVAVSGNYAYVTSILEGGLEVIDISNPANPVHAGVIYNGNGGAALNYPTDVFVSGNYAYIASNSSDALEIVNISSSTNPVHAGKLIDSATTALNGARGVYVEGMYAYVVSDTDYGLEIINISSSTNPTHVGAIFDDATTLLGQFSSGKVTVSGNYAYVAAGGIYDNGIEVINISNPAAPTHVTSVVGSGDMKLSSPYDIQIVGSLAYISVAASEALEILDITDPANPVHVGAIVDNTTTALARAGGLFVSGDFAYITARSENGLEILNISSPTAPVHVASVTDSLTTGLGGLQNIVVSGDYAYGVSPEDNAFEVIDISSSTNPVHVGVLFDNATTLLAGAQDLAISGNYAYVVSNDPFIFATDGLEVIDISDPANPTHVTALLDDATLALNYPTSIVIEGNYAYITSYFDKGLEILDISNPASPTHVGKILDDATTALSYPCGVFVLNNYAYVISDLSEHGFEIINISNPANPTHVRAFFDDATMLLNTPSDILVSGDYAYVTASGLSDKGLEIINISNPASPFHVGKLADNTTTALNSASSIHVQGNYAYVTAKTDNGLEIINISNLAAPTHVSSLIDDSTLALRGANDLVVVGDYMYIASFEDDGLQILNVPSTKLRLGVDWNMDSVVDEWSATTSANLTWSTNHSWSSVGAHTFQTFAEKNPALRSAWSSFTTTLIDPNDPVLSTSTDDVTSVVAASSSVTFNAFWMDPNVGDTVRILISEDPNFADCNYVTQSGCLAASSPTTVSPQSVSYTTNENDADIKWYARACDDDGNCSSVKTGGVFLVSSLPCQAHNVYGFAWAGSLGWTSFSCEDITSPQGDYGVALEKSTGILSGFAWSDEGGRVSFNPAKDGVASENGLIGGYTMNEDSGIIAYDVSRHNNHGTLVGASWIAGKYNTAVSFDESSYVTIPSSASLNNIGDQVALEAWIRPTTPTDQSNWHTIVGKDDSLLSTPTYSCGGYSFIASENESDVYFVVQNRWLDGVVTRCSPVFVNYTLPTMDQWYHIVGMYDKNTSSIKLYVNGVLVDSTAGYVNVNAVGKSIGSNNKPLTIGGDPDDTSAGPLEFKGQIDEVRVYDRVLSDNEVKAHYQSYGVLDTNTMKMSGWARACVKRDVTGNYECGEASAVESFIDTIGLVAGYTMDEDAGTSVGDVSASSTNDGTFTGGVSWALGRFNTGLRFDGGASSYMTVPDSPSLNITGAITMEVWVKPDVVSAGGDFRSVLSKSQGGLLGDEAGYALYTNEDQTASCFQVKSQSSGYINNCETDPPELVPNTWNHLVGIYNSATSEARYYVNGSLVVSETVAGSIDVTSNSLYIGGNPAVDDQIGFSPYKGIAEFQGEIDDIRIYNRALTEGEVVSHFRGYMADHSNVWNGWMSLSGTTISYGAYNMLLNTTPSPHEVEGWSWMGTSTPTGHKQNEAGKWAVFDCGSCASDPTCGASYPPCTNLVHLDYKVRTNVAFNGPDAPINIKTENQTNPFGINVLRPTLGAEYENTNISPSTGNHWDKADEELTATQCNYPDTTYNMCYDLATNVYTYSMTEQADVYALENTPMTGTINSVTVRIRYHGGIRGPILRLNGVETIGGSSATDTGHFYNDHYEPGGLLTQTLSRPGGGSWTWADINDLQAGAYVRSTDGAIATSTMGWLAQLYVVVTYDTTSTLILMPNGVGDYANISYQEPAGAGPSTDTASAYQVQVMRDGSGWSSTTWDSGKTTCAVNEGDREEVAYGGSGLLPIGRKYYQRWKFWDSGGKEGPWSDGTDFWIMQNTPPTNPTIGGPTTGASSTSYLFDFNATSTIFVPAATIDQSLYNEDIYAGLGEWSNTRYRGMGFTPTRSNLVGVAFDMDTTWISTDLKVYVDTANTDSIPDHTPVSALYSWVIPFSQLVGGLTTYYLPTIQQLIPGNQYVMYYAPWNNLTDTYVDDYRDMSWKNSDAYAGGKPVINNNGEWSVSDSGNLDQIFETYATTTGAATNQIRYGIDWDMNGTVDGWIPIAGYVPSGTTQSTTTSWSTSGLKIFQALAQNGDGSSSGWKQHSISIDMTNTPPQAAISSPSLGVQSAPTNLQGAFFDADGDSFIGFEWYEGTCLTGTLLHSAYGAESNPTSLYEIVPPLSLGAHSIFFRVRDDSGESNSWSDCQQRDIVIANDCDDGNVDNDGDLLADSADPGCYQPLANIGDVAVYDSTIASESPNPQCSNNIDDDGDGKKDTEDGGCYDNWDVSTGTYVPYWNREQTCGVETSGLRCDFGAGETFGKCPVDCSKWFWLIEF